ncbi:MAG: hypothetical protein FD157_3756 [Rhodocyclaceae bacterium]|nr:MAG: hypothetical protein FD157_3756 [Rhodocyclaceae bacterium]TNC99888.1 MAG: hypothetical protein FD118_3567 [Rhodocyclaceae bacterium]
MRFGVAAIFMTPQDDVPLAPTPGSEGPGSGRRATLLDPVEALRKE